MPYTGYCSWEDCDPNKKNPRVKISDYMYEMWRIILCRKHMKQFKKLPRTEKVLYANSQEWAIPRYSVK